MKTKWKIVSTAVTSLLTVSLFFGSFIGVANAISAGPGSFEITANPGEEVVKSMTLSNNETKAINLTVSAQDYLIDPTSGNKQFTEVAAPRGCKDWITFDQSEQMAEPGETKSFPFTIKVPKDAAPGTYYTGIFASTKAPAAEDGGSQIGVVGRVLSDLSITIAGDFNEEATLIGFTLDENQYKEGNIIFNVDFKNTGDVLLAPMGSIKIFDDKGVQVKKIYPVKKIIYEQEVTVEEKDELPINQYWATTLPETSRTYLVPLTGALSQGKYTAKLELVYGSKNTKVEAEQAFEITKTFYISEFNSDKYFYSGLPAKFNLKIKNSGTTSVQSVGYFEIKNIFGSQKKKIDFLPEEVLLNGGEEKTIQNLTWDSGFALGMYKADVVFKLGDQSYEKSITFLVMNWWQGLIIIVVIALICVIVYKGTSVYFKAKKQLKSKA